MKVLHVIPSVSEVRGGPSQAVIRMVKELRESGIDAEIATTNDSYFDLLDVPLNQRIEYKGVPVWFFGRISSPLNGFVFSAAIAPWLWKHIRDYDILSIHYLFSYASTCAAAIARFQGIPYTIRPIGQLAPWALTQGRVKKQIYSFLIERHNLNRAAAIHCTSAGEAEDVRNFGVVAPAIVLPLGVNQPQLLPEAKQKLRQIYGISPTTPVLLFLSRLHPKKRPELLLEALMQLAAQNYDFHLILAGIAEDKNYPTYLTDLVSSLGLTARTSIPGFVTGEDKDLLLQGSDIFVLPSFSENFGVAVAEAIAAGLPAIVTPGVQIAPEIAAAKAGLVVPGEVQPLADAISQLLTSASLRQELGENGRRLATRCYSWPAIGQNSIALYRAILEKQSLPQNLTNSEFKC